MIRVLEETENGRTIFRIDGQLDAEGAAVLEQLRDTLGSDVTLNLRNVIGVDRVGIETLFQLVERGANLENVPPYIAVQLDRQS